MRRKITVFIIIGVCYLLQTTFFDTLSFASISPNLLIIVTSSFGFMRGRKEGLLSVFLRTALRYFRWRCSWILQPFIYVYRLYQWNVP